MTTEELEAALAAEKAARGKAETDRAYAMTEARRSVDTLAALTTARARITLLEEALKLTSARLEAFIRAVADLTDCSDDVAALDAANAALNEPGEGER
jgi:hypothetical protein